MTLIVSNNVNQTKSPKVLAKAKLSVPHGSTALQVLEHGSKVHWCSKHEAESSGWGKYINRICDKDQDHKNMAYWMFLINGKLADEGAGSFKVKREDVIEFRYSLTEIRHKPNSMYYPASYKKMT